MGWISRFTPAARALALAAALAAPGAAAAQGATPPPGSPALAKAPIVTPIAAAGDFWPAEDYHQDFYKKNPARYKYYRAGCGRDARLMQLWGKAGD